jgi:hypothetical protein
MSGPRVGERVRVAVAVERGEPVVVHIVEPDDERARALDDEAAKLGDVVSVNGCRRRAEALAAFADVFRAQAATSRRYPGQREL